MTQAPPTQATDASPAPSRMRVAGEVQHRIGDGVLEIIPIGQEVEVSEAIASMVLSWQEGGQGVTAILAKDEFQHYVDAGALTPL